MTKKSRTRPRKYPDIWATSIASTRASMLPNFFFSASSAAIAALFAGKAEYQWAFCFTVRFASAANGPRQKRNTILTSANRGVRCKRFLRFTTLAADGWRIQVAVAVRGGRLVVGYCCENARASARGRFSGRIPFERRYRTRYSSSESGERRIEQRMWRVCQI